MSKSEHIHHPNTPLRAAVLEAIADVDAISPSDVDRPVILKALLEARLRQVNESRSASAGNDDRQEDPEATAQTSPPEIGDPLDKIAQTLRLPRETLDLIYDYQDGEPHLVVSTRKISNNKASATRQIGQLIASARQAAGLEEWTSVGTIRAIVQDYGRLDSGNFAAIIQQTEDVWVMRGKGQQREVKVTKPGFESTGNLVRRIAGQDIEQ